MPENAVAIGIYNRYNDGNKKNRFSWQAKTVRN